MPQNPFVDHKEFEPKPKRNSFDMSFQNNMTMAFGALYPCMCMEVLPGDSVSIDAALALRMMPFVFPVQTPIRATMHFFYVRNRNIWKDWPDFVYGNRTDLVHPYLGTNTRLGTGSLSDYLGIPSTVGSSRSNAYDYRVGAQWFVVSESAQDIAANLVHAKQQLSSIPFLEGMRTLFPSLDRESTSPACYASLSVPNSLSSGELVSVSVTRSNIGIRPGLARYSLALVTGGPASGTAPYGTGRHIDADFGFVDFDFPSLSDSVNIALSAEQRQMYDDALSAGAYPSFLVLVSTGSDVAFSPTAGLTVTCNRRIGLSEASSVGVDLARSLHLNALPFRAYESIYNAFYRDMQNDPWEIDGVPQYNNYCTTHEGGVDQTSYHLFYRNWEKDFLTSALPTPQQGLAPLVGITSTGRMSIQREDGSIAEVQAVVGDDGDTIVGFKSSAALEDAVVRATAFAAATSGISINDFRNVNALQRWLENNIRRGLKYRDQLLANTGVSPKYDELDMPEFLGGFSRMVNVSQISQTTETDSHPLGDYAGQGNLFGGSEHTITHYCDEHGFIMGILCVVPQPAYSQLLPKMFLKTSALDYYNPVFGHIGMQPITYSEVCPNQVLFENGDIHLTDTFGYQRPWYDLIARVDEVHGEMRKTMRDYVMNRTFDVVPQLGPDFLHIDPDQLNDVFAVTGDSGSSLDHKIMGQIVFKIYKKTAIPRFGIPRLEA